MAERRQNTLPFLPTTPGHAAPNDAPALFDDASTKWLSYGALRERIAKAAAALNAQSRGLVMCCPPRSIDGATAYLAAAEAGHAIALADPAAPNLDAVAQTYAPEWIVAPEDIPFNGYERADWSVGSLALWTRTAKTDSALHPDFYLMLLTSGSTGSAKGVRLSYANIASNTNAIVESYRLTDEVTALGHMPLSYSFGLSILQTQLAVGGRCALTEESMMSGPFWKLVREQDVALFPGVPYHYEMLMRLGLKRLKAPKLRIFLQAGGKMQVPLTRQILESVQQMEGGELFIMYGQTEASPRISCFPLHRYPEKIGSSGRALKGGKLEIIEDEIVYTGPNVMMGPATTRADLATGDVMGGTLHTGDLGELDPDGFLTITGRKQRFAKLFGQRVALDDLERIASPVAFAVAVEHPEKAVLITLCDDETKLAEMKDRIVAQTKLPPAWVEIRSVAEIPHKPNGKIDYQYIQRMVCSGT